MVETSSIVYTGFKVIKHMLGEIVGHTNVVDTLNSSLVMKEVLSNNTLAPGFDIWVWEAEDDEFPASGFYYSGAYVRASQC